MRQYAAVAFRCHAARYFSDDIICFYALLIFRHVDAASFLRCSAFKGAQAAAYRRLMARDVYAYFSRCCI